MPLQQTDTGLQIQSAEEIKGEYQDAFRDSVKGFGAGAQVRPNSPFGQLIGILTEREALWQQQLQLVQSNFDANEAAGVDLDVLCALTGTVRRAAKQSASGDTRILGVDTTVIPDGSRVQNNETQEIWETIGGPYTIVGGLAFCTIIAQDTGPLEFLGATTWTILDTIPGWNTFITTSDIDPEDIGRDREEDVNLRIRRETELFSNGNDLSAIKAQVSKVVDDVAVYENQDCTQTVDGIPPGAFEVITEGGDSVEIANAIYSRKPPGAESFGSTSEIIEDLEGNSLSIEDTPVTDVDIWIVITITIGVSAEAPVPDNSQSTIANAVIEFANAATRIGQDVVPDGFGEAIWPLMKNEETGLYWATILESKAGLSFGTSTTTPTVIDLRSRADYDNARILVSLVL